MPNERPWDTAEHESVWAITGRYPEGGSFTTCLAITAPGYVTGTDKPLFLPIGAWGFGHDAIPTEWVTAATPLLLVHRDHPQRAYWTEDQHLIGAQS